MNSAFFDTIVLDMPAWKWLSLVGLFVGLYFMRVVVRWLFLKIKKAEAYFPGQTFMHFFLEEEIEKSLSWIVVSAAALVIVGALELSAGVHLYASYFFKLLLAINVIRTCYMAAEAFGMSIQEWAKTTETALDDQLAPLVSKTLKVLVIIIGVLVALQNFGVNVTALLAGLGIGGIALAFAAQDTVANVFGTITILLDGPFKLGDHIKIGETEGIVAEVGFRSTSIRTLYNSIVTIPNSVVAKERSDNMSQRNGWVRFRHTLGFTYDATPEQLNQFAEKLKKQLMEDSSVDRHRIVINFNSYGDSSLNVLVNFHFSVQEDEVEAVKINTYLDMIYNVSLDCKLAFAFPTRTLLIPAPLTLTQLEPKNESLQS